MKNLSFTKGNAIPNKVKINFDMLRPLMLHGVARHVDDADVVAVDHRGTRRGGDGARQGAVGAKRIRRQRSPPPCTLPRRWTARRSPVASTTMLEGWSPDRRSNPRWNGVCQDILPSRRRSRRQARCRCRDGSEAPDVSCHGDTEGCA